MVQRGENLYVQHAEQVYRYLFSLCREADAADLSQIPASDNPAQEVEERSQRMALYQAMQKLDAETREVLYLRLSGEFSFREIGEILGKSEV